MFTRASRSTGPDETEKKDPNINTSAVDNATEAEESQPANLVEEKSSPQPTSIFVTTINPDSSITEENMPITPLTPATHDEQATKEPVKFVPMERKQEYSFIMLITSQGQEVLKSNGSSLPIDLILLSFSEHRKLEFLCRIAATTSECYRDECKQTSEIDLANEGLPTKANEWLVKDSLRSSRI